MITMGSYTETPDWSNLSVLHRNVLPPRANFKIYTSEADALSRDESKARVRSLAGTWKFHLANSPFDAPEGFEAADFDDSQWSDIPVPSMWQLKGFGKGPVYTNVAFPIFVDPPHAPFDDNECGSYLTSFSVPQHLEDDQLRIRLEGVDAAYHIWINGYQLGYHQGSRNPAEFDITEHVHRGGKENILAVRVYQFCDATYIEDQDQWRMSGIFRDVHLLGFPKAAHFQDFSVQTIFDDAYENAKLEVQVEVQGEGTVALKLYDAEFKQVVADTCTTGDRDALKFSIPVSSPHKWTAETPYLYHLTLSLGDGQVVSHRVGFRQVELKDGLIKVNGKRIVIKGANRHEHHPVHGRTVPYEFMKQDLLLMKTHNINAIRSCHQPSDPRMYDLADEMGFWVMVSACSFTFVDGVIWHIPMAKSSARLNGDQSRFIGCARQY
jgi:beta-galactosidase